MASLLASASPWENAPVNTKKKATMKKLVYGDKKNNVLTRPSQPPPPQQEPEQEDSDVEENGAESRFDMDMRKNTMRQNAVHEHIQNMTAAPGPMNAGDFLAAFKPISSSSEYSGRTGSGSRNPLLPIEPKAEQMSYRETFTQNNPVPSPNNEKYSNYTDVYQPQNSAPYYARQGLGNSGEGERGNDNLMEKINYLIHLLEEQQSEKTNYITEEFLLYGCLGIFMIFIVDSFSRSGKYVR
jgi:hypothetical protein